MAEKPENMPPEKNELDDFLKDVPKDGDAAKEILGEVEETKIPEKDAEPEEDGEVRKNRRHRRLEAQLAEEREARIAAEARAEALSETRKFTEEVGSDEVSQKLARLYGTDENGKQAAQITKELLENAVSRGKEEALKEIEANRRQEASEQAKHESFIDSQLEKIEDDFNVDVTSNAPAARKARKEFLDMVQQFSPKDENGTVIGFADFNATWEAYQLKRSQEKPSDTSDRQKSLADRSMTKSGNVDVSKAEKDTELAWLRRNGIQV